MKRYLCLLTLLPACGYAQDTATAPRGCPAVKGQPNIIASLSVGALNIHRRDYGPAAGYERNNISGFLPIYGRLEYGIGRHTCLAATFGYDAFVFNYNQLTESFGGMALVSRYKSNKVRVLSAGAAVFYHILRYDRIRGLDPYIGLGFSLNNITQSAYATEDSIFSYREHSVSPYIKMGIRYYLSYNFSLFGDIGYEGRSLATIGASMRLGKPPKHIPRDSDGDGVPDKRDSCVYSPGPAALNGCPDRDGDGIADKYDACPDVAGLPQFNGCPDTDGDGIPDKDDRCPTLAGLQAMHGCPDRDGDGIADEDDHCPDLPGLAVYSGCPDTDGDGIPDNEDPCPLVAGPADHHGCPDTVKKNLTLKRDRITFLPGKATLTTVSYQVLDEVAETVKKDGGIYIIVDGYADNTGKAAVNKVISARRALVVKKYLVRKGLPATRIMARGHGSTHPVASNHTAAGRAKNRRAAFRLRYQ